MDSTEPGWVLDKLRRMSARWDKAAARWMVPKFQEEQLAALMVMLGEEFKMVPDPEPVGPSPWSGCVPLVSGWVLTAAGPDGVTFLNPYCSAPHVPVTVTWKELWDSVLKETGPRREALMALHARASAKYPQPYEPE